MDALYECQQANYKEAEHIEEQNKNAEHKDEL